MENQDLITILQASLTPVVLISGVGLLLLSMTNRIARPLDRIRFLGKELKTSSEKDQSYYLRQIEILYKRCFLLKKAITAAVLSIISISVIILFLFLMKIFALDLSLFIECIFIIGLFALAISLVYFLKDIRESLKSVTIEMERLKTNFPDINIS
jgi:hypothetical protein